MLEIDRLSLRVRAAAAPERAQRLALRLRDAAVAGIERNRFAPAPPGAPAYLFIERLALRCSVAGDWDDAAIGAEVARALAAALEHAVELPGAVAFRDRVELLAAFYAALAEGRAWDRWWFEAFDGLRALPASAALRTSVINEDARGAAALARLTETSLANVLGLLTAGDAARLLAWFAERRTQTKTPLASVWKASLASKDDAGRLRALIGAERAAPGAANGQTLRVLWAMSALRSTAARDELSSWEFSSSPPQEVLRRSLAKLSLEAHWVEELGQSEAALIVEELASVCKTIYSTQKTAKQAAAANEQLFTERGGAFVLLKALDWLGWPTAWRKALSHADPELDRLVRALSWAAVLRALEPRSTSPGFSDAALQAVFDLERPLALLRAHRGNLHKLSDVVDTKAGIGWISKKLLEEFSRRIPGLADASPDYLRKNALALPATLERRADGCVVRLGRAPLDILLVLAGAKTGRIGLPGGAPLQLRESASA